MTSYVELFAILGPKAGDVAPDILELLRTTKYLGLQQVCVRTLGRIGPVAKPAISTLKGFLDARLIGMSNQAAVAIVKIGWQGSGLSVQHLAPRILRAFETSRYRRAIDRQEAGEALALLGNPAEPYVVDLALQSGDPEKLLIALRALDAMDAKSLPAISVLVDALSEEHPLRTRSVGVKALGDIRGTDSYIGEEYGVTP